MRYPTRGPRNPIQTHPHPPPHPLKSRAEGSSSVGHKLSAFSHSIPCPLGRSETRRKKNKYERIGLKKLSYQLKRLKEQHSQSKESEGRKPREEINEIKTKQYHGKSLAVQWLGLHAFAAEGLSSIPSGGT